MQLLVVIKKMDQKHKTMMRPQQTGNRNDLLADLSFGYGAIPMPPKQEVNEVRNVDMDGEASSSSSSDEGAPNEESKTSVHIVIKNV